MATTKIILRHARYLDELDPGFLAKVIMAETGRTIENAICSIKWPD